MSPSLTEKCRLATIPSMVKLTRTINSLWLIILSLCLLIACNEALAFFKKPPWLNGFSQEDMNFWSKLSQDFAIDCDEQNPVVQQQIRWYQAHPKHLRQILKHAEPLLHYVYEQTHRNHLPAELALIPLLESQYNPAIGARSGAAGLWQIMPGTATKFGLKINTNYDGRRDVTASTKVALKYLSYLHRYFNQNWLLALAAYDAGEGKVESVSKRHMGGFWQLPLSRETREYVPKILALASIIKQPKDYNVTLPTVSQEPSLQEMTWREANVINLSETAKHLGVDNRTFKALNPGIRKNIATVPSSLTLLVPRGAADTNDQETSFNQQIETEIPLHSESAQKSVKNMTSKKTYYKIRKGDNLSSIAKRFHISARQLKKTNQLKNEKQLKIGKKLVIPNVKHK